MVEHTPTPWRLHGLYPEEIYATVDNKRMQVADVSGACSSDQDVSNAAFIVMAVNNHAALVKALKECAMRCRYDGDLFHDQGNEMRRDASWKAGEHADAILASVGKVQVP